MQRSQSQLPSGPPSAARLGPVRADGQRAAHLTPVPFFFFFLLRRRGEVREGPRDGRRVASRAHLCQIADSRFAVISLWLPISVPHRRANEDDDHGDGRLLSTDTDTPGSAVEPLQRPALWLSRISENPVRYRNRSHHPLLRVGPSPATSQRPKGLAQDFAGWGSQQDRFALTLVSLSTRRPSARGRAGCWLDPS